jgi:hypothetical protein
MKTLPFACSIVALACASGCYTTTLSSGKPVGEAADDADGHWHSGFLTGGVDASGEYELKKLCPNGWAEIETETSVVNEIVELATYRLYAPQTVTVRCAAEPERTALARE